ncbi:hypothetical protein Hte_002678 [Hypoxylon texense]
MEALRGISDPLGFPWLDSTDIEHTNMQTFPPARFSGMYGSMHGPVQAMSYFGSNTPHVPEESGDDCFDLDVNRHPQPEIQTSHPYHVINYAPFNTLLIPCDPFLLSSEGSGQRSPSADSAREEERMRDVNPPYNTSPNGLRIVAYKGPKMKTKRESNRCHAYRVDALLRDKNPRSHIKRDESGLLQGAFRVFGINERIRSRSHPETRSTAAVTRAVGACGRCRGQKLKCAVSKNMFLPCERCSMLPHRYLKAPCIRVNILDLNLHRRGSTLNNRLENWTLAQEEFARSYLTRGDFQGLEILDVFITQDQGIEIPVTIRRFNPQPGDITSWKWRDSTLQEKTMEMPPFYICDTEDAGRNMRDAVECKKAEYINYLLGDANPILRKTFEAAFRYLEVSTSTLVSDCLTFWVATRFIEKPWRICCGALPGFEPPYEPECPYNGIIPVTPIMDTQIDDLAIRTFLDPLGKRILRELSRKIHEKKRENWFDIYLATFIIMNNFEFVFTDVLDYTSRHGLKPTSTGARSLSKAYFHACKTLLVYFRFACNGHGPFSLCWNQKQQPQPQPQPLPPTDTDTGTDTDADADAVIDGLTFDQQEYLRDLQSEVDRQRAAMEAWRAGSVYRTPLYLCYQVLVEDWRADVPHSEPIDNFTEEDFLTS